MYSTTITPKHTPKSTDPWGPGEPIGIKSDGQLHRSHPPAPPQMSPPPKAPPRKGFSLTDISSEQILIIVILYLLLKTDKPDWMLIIALGYILL